MKKRLILINTASSMMLQIINIISGFIIPKIILSTFGSEVNGLVSSLNQFLGYISLFEGGVSGVISAALYRPVVQLDMQKISEIVKTADEFFKKIAISFVVYAIVLSVIYPLMVHTEFTFTYICTLVWIMSIALFVQYFFSLSMKLLINADGKVYVVCLTQAAIVVLNTVVTLVVIKMYPSIHLLKLFSSCLYLLQPIIFNRIVKNVFCINKLATSNPDVIRQRWDGFGINLAAFIHDNTDMVVLTMLSRLKEVSVYSVYLLVVTGLRRLIVSMSNAMAPGIGQAYAKGDHKELKDKFRKYEFTILYITYILFTVGGLCITPFVQLYTRNISDTNYNQPVFGWIIVAAELIFCIREPYVSLAYAAGRFRDFTKAAYAEAIVNIVLSIILVVKYGITGVAVGTLVSMGYRTFIQIKYLHDHILYKKTLDLFKNVTIFLIGALIVILMSNMLIDLGQITIMNWICFALKNTVLAMIVFSVILFVLYRLDLKAGKENKNEEADT